MGNRSEEPFTVSAAVQINSVTAGDQSEPVVARYDGSFLVVWRSSAGVWARVVEADGTPARGEQQVNTTATDLYFDPSVATSHEGHFVVTWDTEDDFDYGGYRRARLFEELGPSIFGDGFESGDTSAWE